MQALHVGTLEELRAVLAAYGDDCLFRGQTNAYRDTDGALLLNSSFRRQGCVPPLMLKWSFYVRELLRRGGFDVLRDDEMHFVQGLLQHYGWRSFFVDLSASKEVAAWFAGCKFQSKGGWQFCENSFEQPVMLRAQRASYTDHEGEGNFFVLSKDGLTKVGHALVNLFGELTTDTPTRFQAQQAWLAGIFKQQTRLDPAAIIAHITAPANVLRAFASSAGFRETGDVFPGPDQDMVLKNFLGLPRSRLDIPDTPLPFYVRSLDIPEYQESFIKHLPPSTVLASPLWLSDIIDDAEQSLWIRVPEDAFYGSTDHNVAMPRLAQYFRDNPITHIETNGVICYPVLEDNETYHKGIAIRRNTDGFYEVGALTVDYFSDEVRATGVSLGYTYRIGDNRLVRVPTDTDCPCGDNERHRYHIQTFAVIEDILGFANVERRDNIVTVRF
jgi:hypothetical protein